MRSYDKRRYIFALIITVAIFSLGFFFGFILDIKRADYFKSLNEEQKLNIRSIQLQYEIISSVADKKNCEAFKYVFNNAVNELERNRERLEIYDQQSKINKEEFVVLRREYVISQINFWHISKKYKETCPEYTDFLTVVYFFSDKEKCPDCEEQSSVLNYYKNTLKEKIFIFAIDENFESHESLIGLLKKSYSINEYPSLIIEDEKFTGFVDSNTFKKIVCKHYKNIDVDINIC